MDYSIVTRAGLTAAEFAQLVGVSRVMAWKYIKKGTEPRCRAKGINVRQRVVVALMVLTKLVEKGALPKPELAVATTMHPDVKAARTRMLNKLTELVDTRVAQEPANR